MRQVRAHNSRGPPLLPFSTFLHVFTEFGCGGELSQLDNPNNGVMSFFQICFGAYSFFVWLSEYLLHKQEQEQEQEQE